MIFNPNNGGFGEYSERKRFIGESSPRYSFRQAEIGRTDQFIKHASGMVRIIEYAAPHHDKTIKIHDILSDLGVVLGTEIDTANEGDTPATIAYRVPESARPLREESSTRASGEYSYPDTMLFADLGRLLGKIRGRGLRFDGEIGLNVAIVGFTKPNEVEHRLLFAPGAEYYMRLKRPGTKSRNYYEKKLINEFGDRFHDAVAGFNYGYFGGMIKSVSENK